jgi:hypothetical protein
MNNAAQAILDDKLEAYDRLIATLPEIERKGKSMPYTSINGHMFTHLDKSGTMGIRLPAEAREAFLAKYGTTLFVQHGATMKEYATVPDELLQSTEELMPYLQMSYEYIKTLKPKPTKKKS